MPAFCPVQAPKQKFPQIERNYGQRYIRVCEPSIPNDSVLPVILSFLAAAGVSKNLKSRNPFPRIQRN